MNHASTQARSTAGWRLQLLFGATVFLAAVLVFQIQPLVGRFLLPEYGGAPAVWTTCLCFFQVMLLAGYCYAHLLCGNRSPRAQAHLHAALVVLAMLSLPLRLAADTAAAGGGGPAISILQRLLCHIALPYGAAAATAPLMQRWLGDLHQPDSPYRLYALSNAGSLVGLLAYPFLIEPLLPRHLQSALWSGLFALWAVLVLTCCWTSSRRRETAADNLRPAHTFTVPSRTWLLWLLIPACTTVLLLATTTHLTEDIAPSPFLWVAPLTLFLLSYVIAFAPRTPWPRAGLALFWGVLLVFLAVCSVLRGRLPAWLQIAVLCLHLLAACLLCHRELHRLRPEVNALTGYYLAVAGGGAAGGLFVALICPVIFSRYWEFPAAVMACLLLVAAALYLDPASRFHKGRDRRAWAGLLSVLLLVGLAIHQGQGRFEANTIARTRNFFGILSVLEMGSGRDQRRILQHGHVTHGIQFTAPQRRHEPLAYMGPDSGIAAAFGNLPQGPRRIGAVGLGIGAVCTYVHRQDTICFYEINPEVEHVARTWFTCLEDCQGMSQVVIADGRLGLAAAAESSLDLIIIDAFSGHAIPAHLLTVEAFRMYAGKLRRGGIIALNISSRHVDLEPLVHAAAWHLSMETVVVRHRPSAREPALHPSVWALVTDQTTLAARHLAGIPNATHLDQPPSVRPWTDDRMSLLPHLK